MIESFNVPHNDVPKWAGILSAVFSISQCLTAIFWVRLSDTHGRKPIILMAMFFAMTSSLFFGFSTSLAWCIVARAMSGASNGNVGILRTTVAEMVPQKALQPVAFATLPLVWQVGSVVGPFIGGALANPARSFPAIFGKNQFLIRFPYALPNLISCGIFTVGLMVGILFLKESLESKKYDQDYGRVLGNRLLNLFKKKRRGSLRPADDFESNISRKSSSFKALKPPAYREVFQGQSNLTLGAYFILALHSIAYDQLLPVLMHLPVTNGPVNLPLEFSSGLGLDSSRIGLIVAIIGGFAMVCQFTVFPLITTRYGALHCFRAATLLFPISYLITPYLVLMPTSLTRQMAVVAIKLVQGFAGVFAFPCVTILMTNSAKSVRLLGTLNGVATSLSAIGRACGPYLAGSTFTWGVKNNYGIAPWWLLALFAVPGHIITWWLVESDGFGDNGNSEAEESSESIPLDATRSGRQAGLSVDANFSIAGSDLDLDSEDDDDDDDDNDDDDDRDYAAEADKPLLRTL
jgi:MFS family permease